ncbi:hypothetical protein [Marinobacter nauticus]|jgi:hypothetical protein|uniref:hypothetical protein n=1 Tax=Marinobacter nauticus TaxID=2743 RepID=UPI001CD62B1E|nr:hypothetical protein [Marinobacter nauticus]MCA0912422.1 hypothetical protein [Marinobacter nauticus]
MAKNYQFHLDNHQVGVFFRPLRRKEEVIRVLLEAIKLMLIYERPSANSDSGSKLILNISKMSRLIFESESKIFSINFPFKVIENDGELVFYTKSGLVLDNLISSEALAFVSQDSVIYGDDVLDFAGPIVETASDKVQFWSFIRELFFYEDGYLRFDHDFENENGNIHPLNHIDICYSSNVTFKVGVVEKFTVLQFLDVLDVTTPCHYLQSKNGL